MRLCYGPLAICIGLLFGLGSSTGEAQEVSGPEKNSHSLERAPVEETPIPFESLVQRSLGHVRQAAVFSWRKSSMTLSLHCGQPIEFNNFNSSSLGLDLRLPNAWSSYRMSFDRLIVRQSRSSRSLKASPYFQAGRSSRWEWRHAIEIPLHEGIGVATSAWLPATQFVLSGVAELGLQIYPQNGMQNFTHILQTRLAREERERIEENSPESMKVSSARHDLGLGLQWDNYFKSGAFWNFRFLVHRAPAAGGEELVSWLSMSLGAGYAY